MNSIKLSDIRKSYGSTVAVDGIDLVIEPGELFFLLGPSGCGKTTLLRMIAGFIEPTGGSIHFDDRNVTSTPPNKRNTGMVFQSYTLFPWLDVQANVEFALRDTPLSKKERSDRAREYLDLVGIADFGTAMPAQLSGGMRQRVAIARALSYRPSVLLMDEPFGALDAQTRQEMQELLLQVWEAHRLNVLFVTHDIDEAIFLSDRIIMLTGRPGRVKLDVRPQIPRPRTVDVLTSPEMMTQKAELLTALREESQHRWRPQ